MATHETDDNLLSGKIKTMKYQISIPKWS